MKDDFGIHVLYDAAFADMRSMEMEVLKVCSFYINRAEPILDTDLRNTYPCVDRLRILDECLEFENKFQEAKLELVLAYLECYEHITDILEQHRIIQAMTDEMARRPKLNLSGTHFRDSYEAEIECVKSKTELIRSVMKTLMADEYDVNKHTRDYLEKCYRLLHEQIQRKHSYVGPEDIDTELNRREAHKTGTGGTRDPKNDLMLDGVEGGTKKKVDEVELQLRREKAMQEQGLIKSHSLQDPKEVAKHLNIPFKNLEMILKDHHERDHLVGVSVHENVSFAKMNEGYPQFMYRNAAAQNKIKFNEKGEHLDVLEFYEGLQIMPKVISAMQQALVELMQCHRPDNGLLSTALEIQLVKYLKSELLTVQSMEGLTLDRG